MGVAIACLAWVRTEPVPGHRVLDRPVLAFDLITPAAAAPEPVVPMAPPAPPPSGQADPAPASPATAATLTALTSDAPQREATATIASAAITSPAPDTAALSQAYAAEVWRHVARHKPQGLRLRGSAHVLIAIGGNGEIEELALVRSSGSERLDRLALETARKSAPFPRPPAGLTPADMRFIIPFDFT